MSKSKRARSIKPRPASKSPLANALLLMLGRAAIPSRHGSLSCCAGRAAPDHDHYKSTGWQSHSVRGFFAGAAR
jgi:hypothetical protein